MQFMVQSRGMNCPVESQKGAMPPLLSMTGMDVAPNSVPAEAHHTFPSKEHVTVYLLHLLRARFNLLRAHIKDDS